MISEVQIGLYSLDYTQIFLLIPKPGALDSEDAQTDRWQKNLCRTGAVPTFFLRGFLLDSK